MVKTTVPASIGATGFTGGRGPPSYGLPASASSPASTTPELDDEEDELDVEPELELEVLLLVLVPELVLELDELEVVDVAPPPSPPPERPSRFRRSPQPAASIAPAPRPTNAVRERMVRNCYVKAPPVTRRSLDAAIAGVVASTAIWWRQASGRGSSGARRRRWPRASWRAQASRGRSPR
jgi:hypothetical protein